MSAVEREAMAAFRAMTLHEVRGRADEFAAAEAEHEAWLARRRERKGSVPEPDETASFVADVQYGKPAARWRELETVLRSAGLWEVGELPVRDQEGWARKLNALSAELSRPGRRALAPGRAPQRRAPPPS